MNVRPTAMLQKRLQGPTSTSVPPGYVLVRSDGKSDDKPDEKLRQLSKRVQTTPPSSLGEYDDLLKEFAACLLTSAKLGYGAQHLKSFTTYPTGATLNAVTTATIDEAAFAIATGYTKIGQGSTPITRLGNAIRVKRIEVWFQIVFFTSGIPGGDVSVNNDKPSPDVRCGLFIDKFPPLNGLLVNRTWVNVPQNADTNDIQAIFAADENFGNTHSPPNMSAAARYDILTEHHHTFSPPNIVPYTTTLAGAVTTTNQVWSMTSEVKWQKTHFDFPGKGMLVEFYGDGSGAVASNLLGSYIMCNAAATGNIVYHREHGQIWYEDEQV